MLKLCIAPTNSGSSSWSQPASSPVRGRPPRLAPAHEAHVVEMDLARARDKMINGENDLFRDRREDLYRVT